MSVIVRELDKSSGGKILLFTKGADAIVKELLSEKSVTSDEYVESQKYVD